MSQPVINLDAVGVAYGDTHALRAVDLRVTPHERVALLGQSGAGKTSLLGLLSGLVGPTSGELTVLGADPTSLRGRRLREHRARIGSVGQHLDMALPLRVIHNVNAGRLGTWSAGRAAWSLVRPSGRGEVLEALEQVGLANRIDDRTDSLSGGERQRVAFARLLVHRPDLALADEPTSSVDPDLADSLMGMLCAPDKPWTVVASMHDPDLALRHAGRIVGLKEGVVVFDRPTAQVSRTDIAGLYERSR
ncbi:MAG: ATP-binding cassette domain-containing protein [Acidimicrobiales bacterium]